MTWQSSNRGTPDGAFIDAGAVAAPVTVVAVPTVPANTKRVVCLGAEQGPAGSGGFFDMMPPSVQGLVTNGSEVYRTMSPTVFREDGYRFFFFSREEERVHVHVVSGDGEAKFWLKPEIELARNYRFSRKQLKKSNH